MMMMMIVEMTEYQASLDKYNKPNVKKGFHLC